MSTLIDDLLFPVIAAIIIGVILLSLKDETPQRFDARVNVGNDNGTNTTQNPSIASANWPHSITELINNMEDIKGGLFRMGCTPEQKDCRDDEKEHWVSLSDYQLGKYEVTQAEWKAVMESSRFRFKDCDRCPVESVTWNDVQLFISELNRITGKKFRLPTEAEWEFAARGGINSIPTLYAGSYSIDKVAWYSKNSGSKTHPVGELVPNELGLYDMSGNVSEWCSDWYGEYSVQANVVENPQGAKNGTFRVFRGGSCYSHSQYCRVAYRLNFHPGSLDYYLGFRLAHSL